MAICGTCGKHDIFLTMTVSPNWPEIQKELLWEVDPAPGANHQRRRHKASDHPDIVACVFELKKNALLKEIKDSIFGKKWLLESRLWNSKKEDYHTFMFLFGCIKMIKFMMLSRLTPLYLPKSLIPNSSPDCYQLYASWSLW